jgi:hypothetical protein
VTSSAPLLVACQGISVPWTFGVGHFGRSVIAGKDRSARCDPKPEDRFGGVMAVVSPSSCESGKSFSSSSLVFARAIDGEYGWTYRITTHGPSCRLNLLLNYSSELAAVLDLTDCI